MVFPLFAAEPLHSGIKSETKNATGAFGAVAQWPRAGGS
jgi:hypothetical protein